MTERERPSDGVQDLIDRLREDGVAAGQEEAAVIIEKARKEADALIAAAQRDAARIRDAAREEAEQTTQRAHDALRDALRDTVLQFTDTLRQQLRSRVERLVSAEMVDSGFLRKLVIALVARNRDAIPETSSVEVLVPLEPLGLNELKKDPAALEDRLSQLAKEIASEAGRDGVTVRPGNGDGVRLRIVDSGVELDLSATSVTALLMEHMQPRFHALLQGVIR